MNGAVLGSPIQHSLSPLLHTSFFSFLGIEASYRAIEVESGNLSSFFALNKADFNYLSLTMPLKEEAIQLGVDLDEVVTKSQSANTLYLRNGRWNLTSTDGFGFLGALSASQSVMPEQVLVLGAGGTARAVAAALDGKVAQIDVLGRSSTRQSQFQNSVTQSQCEYIRWSDAIDFKQYDLVVNTTPAGAADLLAESVRPDSLPVLFDVIYKPWPTVLASRWTDCGGEVINGLELLIYQGIHQLQYALDHTLDQEALAEYVRPILTRAIS